MKTRSALRPTRLRHFLTALAPALFVAVGLVFAAALPVLAADETKTVQSGQSVVIATSAKALTDKSGPLKGTISKAETGTTEKTYTLIYLAPKTESDFTDAVKYSDGEDHTVLVSVTAGASPPTLTSTEVYSQSFKALFVLLIVATILESGLAVLFNWRPFLQLFDARGVKTLISVVFAWFFVSVFDLDIVTRLINVYSGADYLINVPGKLITALVLAGGSAGVNNLFIALGFRSVKTAEQATPKPKPTDAWIAVRLLRKTAVGPVDVLIGPTTAPQIPVAGTISGSSTNSGFLRFFLRDFGRFPTAGGFTVAPGTPVALEYEVYLEGKDSTGAKITSAKWGPHTVAAGAIVDIDLEL